MANGTILHTTVGIADYECNQEIECTADVYVFTDEPTFDMILENYTMDYNNPIRAFYRYGLKDRFEDALKLLKITYYFDQNRLNKRNDSDVLLNKCKQHNTKNLEGATVENFNDFYLFRLTNNNNSYVARRIVHTIGDASSDIVLFDSPHNLKNTNDI